MAAHVTLSRFEDYADTDIRAVWSALSHLPTPAALRGETPRMEWIGEVENLIMDFQTACPRNLRIEATPDGYDVYDNDTPIPVMLLTYPDPYAVKDAEFSGYLRGILNSDDDAPTVWLVVTDNDVWHTIMDNTGMGIGAECLVTGFEGYWSWVVPESGPTTVGSRVTFQRTTFGGDS